MKDTYSCGHTEKRRGGIMIDTKIDKPCSACASLERAEDYAAVSTSCDRAWYASEPCRRPRAQDDGHSCGEAPGHDGSCTCKCGEVCFK